MAEQVEVGSQQYLYLTTTGRRSGQAREIEIWFTCYQDRYYLITLCGAPHNWIHVKTSEMWSGPRKDRFRQG